MTVDEEKIHFALWCVSKAPLLIGCDITKMSKDTFDILTNEEAIAVNQDSLGVQGKKIPTNQPKPSETPKIKDGSKLYVSSCSGGDDQKWSINSDGSITDVDKKFCLDIPNCSNNNVQVEVYKCHIGDSGQCGNSKNQEWTLKNDGTIVSKLNNKCLDVYDFNGPVVETYNCNGGSNQKFVYDSSAHTIKNGQKCLSVSSGQDALEVWAGELSDGAYAVVLANRGDVESEMIARWKEIGLPAGDAKVRDIFAKKDLGTFTDEFTVSVKSHACYFLRITPEK